MFSQNGEDGVLAEILARVGPARRFFVEFGVESGREGNCVYLADVAGWQGLFMEAATMISSPSWSASTAAEDRVRTDLATVTPENVQELFAASGVTGRAGRAVDRCGWRGLLDLGGGRELSPACCGDRVQQRARSSPQTGPAGRLGRRWDGTSYYGASLGALRSLGERKGYRLVHTELSGVNAFFVREDLAEGRFLATEEVPIAGAPNYFQRGKAIRPPSRDDATWISTQADWSGSTSSADRALDSGRLVWVDEQP